MKILFVVPYVPSRIRIRPYEFIRWLGRRGHSVTLLSPSGPSPDEQMDLEEIRTFCDSGCCCEITSLEIFIKFRIRPARKGSSTIRL